MYAKCVSNLFGNENFTKGKKYQLKRYGGTHLIETDYPECYLICNLHHKMTKTNHFSFGMVGFIYYED